jgi:hypothetical protein
MSIVAAARTSRETPPHARTGAATRASLWCGPTSPHPSAGSSATDISEHALQVRRLNSTMSINRGLPHISRNATACARTGVPTRASPCMRVGVAPRVYRIEIDRHHKHAAAKYGV